MKIPENLYYSNEHEWVRVEDGQAYIGITDFAQEHLGDIVFVELPELNAETAAGDQVGVIESVKAVSSMFSPVSGIVSGVNEALEDAPELLNEDPYVHYVLVVRMSDPEELEALLTPVKYAQLCEEEEQGGK